MNARSDRAGQYHKSCYVFHERRPYPAVVRSYTAKDFTRLIEIQAAAFPPPYPSELWWNREQLHEHVHRFPQGALCVEIDGVIAGSMTSLLIDFDEHHPEHTWEEVTDHGYIRNHQPDGDTLYVADLCVHPEYRQWGLGKLLMQSMYEVTAALGLKRLLGAGRMPGYHRVADTCTPQQYVERITSGELYDPVISFLMRCGRTPLTVIADYLDDEESLHYAVLMEWKNPLPPAATQGGI
ncbi:GNAT family N-acetyltransferase [Paenibacillus bovis]|uniref:Acetyltransferase n=1 Tax=Paenibacillus bovis TaxID=1616788 RepID=A0A172ZDT5_9BACL|nr:GNAT family N-acetyltransferase [Paenibacillus bovis]ANF95427.1 acetyltransferase [Paenibacillus bovis]